jgi:excinuclease UvrABC ATPase subunit
MNDTNLIRVRGAREHNLKNLSLDIPKGRITVFTGVSGSGKSSLVFDTIAAEAQRQLNDTFSSYAQGFLPQYGQPEVESIANLCAPVVVDQRRVGGGPRSTVGTFTELSLLLRRLFAAVGEPRVASASALSFNTPVGMCVACEGLGRTAQLDLTTFLDESKSLNNGAILHPDFKPGKFLWKIYPQSGLFDPDKPLKRYSQKERAALLHGTGVLADVKVTIGGLAYGYEGLIERFHRLYIKRERGELSAPKKAVAERYMTVQTCAACAGARLNPAAVACRIEGHNIAALSDLEVGALLQTLEKLRGRNIRAQASKLTEHLTRIVDLGLGYLSPNRETATLSGGETQRLKTIRHLGNTLTGMLYIFDEPSAGLHPRDVERLNATLCGLRDKGNTVLVVEHDPDVIAVADHVVDMGPNAGVHGGQIVFEGTVADLHRANTLTGRYLSRRMPVKTDVRRPSGQLPIRGATLHNLKNLHVDIPAGVLTVVTGVAGSGKTTLVGQVFAAQHPAAIMVDQSRLGGSARSVPATYLGIMDDIRQAFAKANTTNASMFSFNSSGSCPACSGIGVVDTDFAGMEGVSIRCEVCEGRRFRQEVLEHTLRGKNICELLDMTADDAVDFFIEKKIRSVLQGMTDVGLGYLTLGQPLNTLSGGEAQRLKLATELHKPGSIYLMDEPTTGLHLSDVEKLLQILDRLVNAGNTVVVVEHHVDVIRQADWVIELGPEGGSGGGQLIFQGTPKDLIKQKGSAMAKYLQPK